MMSVPHARRALPGPAGWAGGLLLALALIALLTLGRLPLVDEDEGEYAEVTAEMVASGQFLAPTLNGRPFYEKPVLLFWLQAPLIAAFGPSSWAFRLPSLLLTAIWVLVLANWSQRRLGAPAAAVVAWLAATSLVVCIVGRAATMDALITLLLTLTLFDIWYWIDNDTRGPLRRAAVWAGLGLLAKGPIALAVPGLTCVAMLIATPPLRRRWRELLDPAAWCICIAIAAPWYLWYGVHSDGAFLDYFLLRENVGRLGGSLQGHGGGPGYYLVVLPLLLLPHSGLLLALLRGARALWAHLPTRFLLLWFGLVFSLFSLAGTKLPHYLLYGCAPLFLLAGHCARQQQWPVLGPALLLPVLTLALPGLARHFALHDKNPYIREMLARGPVVFDAAYVPQALIWLLVALACPLGAWYLRRTDARVAGPAPGATAQAYCAEPVGSLETPAHAATAISPDWRGVAIPGLVSVCGVSLLMLPAITGLQQDPVRDAGRFAATLGKPVVSDDRMPSFSVYLGHATEMRAPRAGDIAFGRLDHPDRLGQRHEVLFAEGGLRIVRVEEP